MHKFSLTISFLIILMLASNRVHADNWHNTTPFGVIASLYKHYEPGNLDERFSIRNDKGTYLSKNLVHLFKKMEELEIKGDGLILSWDLVCNCSDYGDGLSINKLTVDYQANDRARVAVQFHYVDGDMLKDIIKVTYIVSKYGNGWFIDNIIYGDKENEDFVSFMADELKEIK